jgi:tetratricopeptide (TPR) repeat protein
VLTAESQADIQMALQRNDLGAASKLAEEALAGGQSHALLFKLAALRRESEGDFGQAAQLRMRAAELDPEDALTLAAAGDALRAAGALRQAIALFDRAIALDDDLVAAWFGRGLALEASGQLEGAQTAFLRVLELDPQGHHGLAAIASVSAKLGRIDEGRSYAGLAADRAPLDPGAIMALARCDLGESDFRAAADRLGQLAGRTDLALHDRVALLTMLGDARDGADDVEGAFASYTAANDCFAWLASKNLSQDAAATRIDGMADVMGRFAPALARQSSSAGRAPAQGHVFLLGFPRSGTTLVEQALLSLPGVVATEEAPTLTDIENLLTAEGIANLAALTENDLAHLRRSYWNRVADEGVQCVGSTYIDMDPSKSAALPAIGLLFPDAKVVVMRRDPRDVVWSCFRRAFSLNAVTSQFTSLESIAAHYASVMRLIGECENAFPRSMLSLVYEEIVDDFDAQMKRLCTFLDLPWSADMRAFDETARRRGVKTVSAGQVRGKLFDGTGQWKRYADKLAPVLPVLEPWIL